MRRGGLVIRFIHPPCAFVLDQVSLTTGIDALALDCTWLWTGFCLFKGVVNCGALIVDVTLSVKPCTSIDLQLHLGSHVINQRLEVESLLVARVALELRHEKIGCHQGPLENEIEKFTLDRGQHFFEVLQSSLHNLIRDFLTLHSSLACLAMLTSFCGTKIQPITMTFIAPVGTMGM